MSEPTQLVRLRQELEKRFNDEDLRTFCQNLGVEYDDLPGQGRASKARELVAFMDRHERLNELEKALTEYEPPQLPQAKRSVNKSLWFRYLVIILPTLLVGFVSDIGGLLGLSRCTQLWVFSALSGLVGVGMVIYWSLPKCRMTYTKQDRALTGLFAFLVTVLFAVLALFCNRNRCPAVSLIITPKFLVPGEIAQLTAHALDPDGDPLTYYWEASHAGLEKSGGPYRSPQNGFAASADLWGQKVSLSVKVDDGKCGAISVATAEILNVLPTSPVVRTPTSTPTAAITSTTTPTATTTPTQSTLVTLPPAEPRAAIALDSQGRIYVAWASKQSGAWDVYFVRSEAKDDGKTFSAVIRPGAGQAARSQPALASSADGVYLAWAEGVPDAHNIYYTRIAPNLGILPPALVNDDTSGSDHTHPALAIAPQGTLYAAWQDRRNGHWDIYGARLQPGATSFEGSRVLAGTPGDQVDPVVAANLQGALYVAWTDLAAEPDQIVYACGLWPNFETVRVTGGLLENLGNEQPALALAPDGRAHLAWANAYVIQPTYGVPIYLPAYAATIGKACTPAEALPGTLQQVGSGYRYVSVRPPESAVAATDTAMHVVLTTFSPRDGSYVWYYRAPANGGGFGEPIVLAHEERVDVLHYPAITVEPNGALHVVWAHQSGEQWRAYYTQSTDGGRTFRTAISVD